MQKCCFIIFAHSNLHDIDDINDIIDNINHFHKNADFMILHPTMNHEKIRLNSPLGALNQSSFIFGPLSNLIKDLSDNEINQFDHFCLVSANQYFINDIVFEKNVNYVQYVHTEDWSNNYNGKNTNKTIIGFPLQQPYGRWDIKDLYKEYGIEIPMSANWECMAITKETMILAKKHIDKCLEYYPNEDMINLFLPYMAIISNQEWEFPPYFGTYDPSNRPHYNQLITREQIIEKHKEGYFSIKRVNYKKDCELKNFIKKHLYEKNYH
jgi:hypothetical protein